MEGINDVRIITAPSEYDSADKGHVRALQIPGMRTQTRSNLSTAGSGADVTFYLKLEPEAVKNKAAPTPK